VAATLLYIKKNTWLYLNMPGRFDGCSNCSSISFFHHFFKREQGSNSAIHGWQKRNQSPSFLFPSHFPNPKPHPPSLHCQIAAATSPLVLPRNPLNSSTLPIPPPTKSDFSHKTNSPFLFFSYLSPHLL